MKFNCTSCGVCCRNLGKLLEYYRSGKAGQRKDYLRILAEEFPYRTNKRGACEKLTKDNFCSVYPDRPTLCNIKKIFELYPQAAKTEKDWYILNAMSCNAMMRQAKVAPIFYITKPFIQ